MQSPLISIIIVQYNNSQDTMGLLEIVKELSYTNFNVIVIDNNSDVKEANSTRLFIESLKNSRFIFISSPENLGYSGGNNLGIELALEHGADYVFILNPDTEIEKGSLTRLIEKAESNPRIGIVGPAIDEGNKLVCGGEVKWLKSELFHNTKYLILNTNLFIPGAAMLIKKEVIEKIGKLDERYFLYFEDADYCMRAKHAGYSLSIVPDALVYHKISTTTSKLGSAKLLYYHYRNAHLFNKKNGPWFVKIILPFWSFFIIIKQFLKIIFAPSKRQISYHILKGVRDFYKGHFGKFVVKI